MMDSRAPDLKHPPPERSARGRQVRGRHPPGWDRIGYPVGSRVADMEDRVPHVGGSQEAAGVPGRLPDFLIIGGMKCGTSSLHAYLGTHPDVFTTAQKEINFFDKPVASAQLDEYTRHFAAAGPALVAGESSPNYTKNRKTPRVVQRIARYVPNVKLVYLLRDPVARILSHYEHNVRKGRELRPFAESVDAGSNYVMTSRYAWHLRHYLQVFPREQVLVVFTEDLRNQRHATVQRVLRFLEVNERVSLDLDREYNVFAQHSREASDDLIDGNANEVSYAEVGGKRVPTARLTRSMRLHLEDALRDDVEELRDILGDGFTYWGMLRRRGGSCGRRS
jgi:hypothetical protein